MSPEERERIRAQAAEYEAAEAAKAARAARTSAVALAVEALKPVAGAYRSTEEYGEQIVNLALHIGAYIRNGA